MHAQFRPVRPGFEHIKRYWDAGRTSVVAKILPGEFYVSKNDSLFVREFSLSEQQTSTRHIILHDTVFELPPRDPVP